MLLTDTQHAVLSLIAERIEADGLPPSQAEIASALGFRSLRAAQYHLEALEAAGAIERLPGRARGIRLRVPVAGKQPELPFAKAQAPDDVLRLPILGRVAAGGPIGSGADAGSDDTLAIDRGLFRPSPDYLLRVEGDSMRDEGILHGDLVGVQRTALARSGQIVVARIDEEITIKRLETSAQGIRLLPCNAGYAPIVVPADADFAVEGLYCGLLRPNPGTRR
ncbi:MAG TPA: transcriptional repressor LexA [Chiayiivirga sp.]|nr:transcriptional repressor LexA [Chiayiivirga sp.]HRN60054.1 transcriptional repressor LexA [Chiayiivirga sp.]